MKKYWLFFAAGLALITGTISADDDNLFWDITRFESIPDTMQKKDRIRGWEIVGFKYSVKEEEGKRMIEAEPLSDGKGRRRILTRISDPRPGKYAFSVKIWSDRDLDQMTLFRYYTDPAGKGHSQQQDFYGKTFSTSNQWKTLTVLVDFPQDGKGFLLVFQISHAKNDYRIRFSDPVLRKLNDTP